MEKRQSAKAEASGDPTHKNRGVFGWRSKEPSGRAARIVDPNARRTGILLPLAVVLTGLWGIGMLASYTMGGMIHILLPLAVIAVVVRLIQRNRC